MNSYSKVLSKHGFTDSIKDVASRIFEPIIDEAYDKTHNPVVDAIIRINAKRRRIGTSTRKQIVQRVPQDVNPITGSLSQLPRPLETLGVSGNPRKLWKIDPSLLYVNMKDK
jgi:hypothetical protein